MYYPEDNYYKYNPIPLDGIRFKILFPNYATYIELLTFYKPSLVVANYTEELFDLMLGVIGNIYFNRITEDTIIPYFIYIYNNAYKKYTLANQWAQLTLEELIGDTFKNKNYLHNVKGYETPQTVEEFLKFLQAATFNEGTSKANILGRIEEIQNKFKTSEQMFLNEMRNVLVISMEHSIVGGN